MAPLFWKNYSYRGGVQNPSPDKNKLITSEHLSMAVLRNKDVV